MKHSNIWFALILVASALLLSAARSVSADSPSPKPANQPNEGSTLSDHQSAQQATPVSTPNFSQSSPDTRSSGNKHDDGGDTATNIIAFFTVVAALATIAIAKFNKQLVTVTADMTTATAQAAKAAEAALHIDRPFLLVTDVKCIESTRDGRANEILYIYEFDVCLRNFGVGPADIVDYIAVAAVRSVPPPSTILEPIVEPEAPRYAPVGRRLSDSLVAPNEWAERRIKERAILTRADCDAVRNGEARIGIDGIIRYRGASQQVYWTRFFWWCFLDAGDSPINIQRALRSDLNDHN
jgi:hypothetical protein